MRRTTAGQARVRTVDGRLYDAHVTVDRWWARLDGARRLSRHGDGYAATLVGDITIPATRIESIRWLAQERAAA